MTWTKVSAIVCGEGCLHPDGEAPFCQCSLRWCSGPLGRGSPAWQSYLGTAGLPVVPRYPLDTSALYHWGEKKERERSVWCLGPGFHSLINRINYFKMEVGPTTCTYPMRRLLFEITYYHYPLRTIHLKKVHMYSSSSCQKGHTNTCHSANSEKSSNDKHRIQTSQQCSNKDVSLVL